MYRIPGFDHRTGHHCGSTSLRNLAEHHDWGVSEAFAFGVGGGIASVYHERPEAEWKAFLGRPTWLEAQFFETFDVAHVDRQGDGFDAAWTNTTQRVDREEPVLLFLDPGELEHVPEAGHDHPHVALAVGYGEDSVLLSDPIRPDPIELPHEELRGAWDSERVVDLSHRRLATRETQTGVDRETAANRAVRETTTYMLDTAADERTTGAVGEHGPEAIRSFALDVPDWNDLRDVEQAARHAQRAITEHGRGAAYRRLYADSLTELAPEAGIGGGAAGRMRNIAEEWEAAADWFEAAAGADDRDERLAALDEAGATLGDIADQEEAFFEHVREELRTQ